jgi:hypothetical protein
MTNHIPSNSPKSVEGSIETLVDFVKRFAWQRGLPIVLQTIHPDTGKIKAFTFTAKQEAELRASATRSMGVENVYFQVNPLKRPISGASKANKEDVAAAHWLQCDLDPNPLDDFETSRGFIKKAFEKYDPKPNLIIDSGGGYQGFWALTDPIEMLPREDGAEPWAEVESRSQQLSLMMSADPCFNIDRIMRAPGTVNMPNNKKRSKGRKPALAQVIHWDDGSYPLERFPKAPVVSVGMGGASSSMGGGREVTISSGNLRAITPEDMHKLAISRGGTLNDYTVMLIVQGTDPDAPDRYKSRSEVLFRVLIDLVKAKFEPDEMAAICTDDDYAISAHVKDQKRPMKYIARQIQRATEAVINPQLLAMNERFAIIKNLGGRHLVVTEYFDEALKRTVLKRQDRNNFISSHAHEQIQTGSTDKGPTFTPLGKWWFYHPEARRYDYLVFQPGQEPEINVPIGAGGLVKKLNLWQGFACEAVPGDCSLYLNHLRDNICCGDLVHYEYLLNWMAKGVQYPSEQGQVCFVMQGAKGAGKSVAANVYGSLFGRHFIQVANASHLVGNFNAHLRDCICVFADEAFYAGDKKHEAVLKALVTEDTLMIESKGIDVEPSPNYIRLIMASNNDWVVPVSSDERRYFIVNVNSAVAQDTSYFESLIKQIDNGGREALLHFLLNKDISNFDVRTPPKTAALNEQAGRSMNLMMELFIECLESGVLPGETNIKKSPNQATQDAFREWASERAKTSPRNAMNTFAQDLKTRFDEDVEKRKDKHEVERPVNYKPNPKGHTKRPNFYHFLPLKQLREKYANLVREWPNDLVDWQFEESSVEASPNDDDPEVLF